MKLTDAEKLSLLMLADIHESLDITGGSVDPAFVREAISSGNTWALSRKYRASAYASEDYTEEAVDHLYKVLDMWSILEESFTDLSAADKKRVEEVNHSPLRIEGFDGHKSELNIVSFIVQNMGGYKSLAGRADMDSHCPVENGYGRMLVAFTPIHQRMVHEMRRPFRLTADEILEVLQAR